MSKVFTVEFEVADVWIEDGFNLTDSTAQAMLENALGYAYPHEIKGRVVKVRTLKRPEPAN